MIDKIVKIAEEAGNLIREGYGKSVNYEYKSNRNDLVTETDRKSEDLIIKLINQYFPMHSILSEEIGTIEKSSEYRWVIDPLDGTTNFAHGLPIFAVSIGIQRNGETVYGVVLDVMGEKIYSAERGGGAYEGGRKLSVSPVADLSGSLLVTGFPYNISENPERAIEKFGRMLKTARGVRRLGSAAIDFCYLADAKFDGFWEVSLKPWDICAGKLIVEEAGGLVTDFEGRKININNRQILASNGKIHPGLIKELSLA